MLLQSEKKKKKTKTTEKGERILELEKGKI